MDETVWQISGVLIAGLGLFGVMMRSLIKEIGKTQSSELRRIEQSVDNLRELQSQAHETLSKQIDREVAYLAGKIDSTHELTIKHLIDHPPQY